jgi:hypothetical protein
MYKPRNVAEWATAIAGLISLAVAIAWFGYGVSERRIATDYEDCAADAQTDASSKLEYGRLLTSCVERFAGRRKIGGGYTYFDFMQNRSFDIAGPNPTEDERKQIDRSYMQFLSAQRREMLLSELAKAQANQELAELHRGREDAGAPLNLTPKIPLPVKRPPVGHPKPCEDGSLSCSWAKLTAAVRNAFASTASKNCTDTQCERTK